MLFRWFVGLGMDDLVWDASVFAKNRDRLLTVDVSSRFLNGIVQHERVAKLLSRDHFSVDGTLIDAWASMKSFRPKDDDTGGDDEGSGRKPDRLCFMGHAVMENRLGLALAATVTQATGMAEREAVLSMLDGNDEMDRAHGDRWVQLQPDGSLKGQIRFLGADEADFTDPVHGQLFQQPARSW